MRRTTALQILVRDWVPTGRVLGSRLVIFSWENTSTKNVQLPSQAVDSAPMTAVFKTKAMYAVCREIWGNADGAEADTALAKTTEPR